MLGLRFCARAFSSCGERGPLFITVHGPFIIAASLIAEHRLQTRRLSNFGSRAHLLHGMWDLPRPGLEPVSPALAGRFPTTAPPGKPHNEFFRRYQIYNKSLNLLIICIWLPKESKFPYLIFVHFVHLLIYLRNIYWRLTLCLTLFYVLGQKKDENNSVFAQKVFIIYWG